MKRERWQRLLWQALGLFFILNFSAIFQYDLMTGRAEITRTLREPMNLTYDSLHQIRCSLILSMSSSVHELAIGFDSAKILTAQGGDFGLAPELASELAAQLAVPFITP